MLGNALRTELRRHGAEVRQLVRRAPQRCDQIEWNPGAPQPLDPESIEGATAAIHLSGANVAAHRWTAAYKAEMTSSRVESTHALATVMAGLRRPPAVLLVASATGIYGNCGDELLDEDSAPGAGFLADLCRAWEQSADPARRAGVRVVHLRFGVVIGPGGALSKMLPLFRWGLGGRLGQGTQWMSWIALHDAIAAIRFLIDDRSIAGPVNLSATNPVCNADFTRTLARVLHRPAPFPAPVWALRLALGEMADEALLASARVQPRRLIAAGFRFQFPEIEAALRAATSRPS